MADLAYGAFRVVFALRRLDTAATETGNPEIADHVRAAVVVAVACVEVAGTHLKARAYEEEQRREGNEPEAPALWRIEP